MASVDGEAQWVNGDIPATRIARQRASSMVRVADVQRMRILSAMVTLASRCGAESATVAAVAQLAGVSRQTFYIFFEDLQDCLAALFDEAVAIATKRASGAYESEARWADRVRASLLALLELADEERELTRLCVAHAVASPAVLIRPGKPLDDLVHIIDEGRGASRSARNPPPQAAQAVLGGVLGMLYARLTARDRCSLVELRNPLMSLIVLPYLGASAAREEQHRRLPAPRSGSG